MYSEHESSVIRKKLPVGTILQKLDARVCHERPSSSYRLRAGDIVAVPESNHISSYRLHEVIDPDVQWMGAPCFSVKAKNIAHKRYFQHEFKEVVVIENSRAHTFSQPSGDFTFLGVKRIL